MYSHLRLVIERADWLYEIYMDTRAHVFTQKGPNIEKNDWTLLYTDRYDK